MYIQRHYFLEHLDPRILLSAGALPTDPSINVSHTIATLSQPRARPGATAVGTKVFFSGGWDAQGIASGTVDILDTVTHQLSTRMLQPNSNNLEYHSVTAANKALFFGGQGVFDIYDSATDTWSSGSLPFSDKQFGITVVGPKIFFDGLATSRVAIYDVQTGQWTSTKIPRRNESPTGVSMAGKVFYMRAGISSVVDIYDSNTGRQSTGRLSQAREIVTVIAVGDRVLFAGGSYRNGIGIPFSNVLDIYNASTGKWSTGKLSSSHGIPRVAATIGTKAYFFSDSNLDIYDVVTGRVTSVASPENVDYNLPIQVIGSKAVLTSSSLTVYSAKIYDANGGNSSSLPFTPRPRFKATSLGTMAFFGGGGPLFFGNMPVDDGTHASPNDNLVDNYTDLSPSPVLSGGLSGRIGQPDQVTVSNTGDADLTGGYTIQLYASRDRTLGGAILVGSANVTSPLVAGTSSPFSIGTVIPQGTPHGQYHLLAAVRDSAGKITPIAAEQGIFSVGGTKGSSKGIAAEGSVRGSGGAFSGRDRARSNGR